MKFDKIEEKLFVKAFVTKNKIKRSLFELNFKKKRINFFSKLCHRYDKILNARCMRKTQTSNSKDIFNSLKKEGAKNTCYIFSFFPELDGCKMPLSDALKQCVGRGMPSIISCIPGKLAYFEAEQEVGPPPRFILKIDQGSRTK